MKKTAAVLAALLLLVLSVMPVMAEKEAVTVSDVDGFLKALASNTTIELAPGEYYLCAASDYGKTGLEGFYTWEEVYDGYELVLTGLENLYICGREGVHIYTTPRYANVLTFSHCSSVTLTDVTAGHEEGLGECSGGVIRVQGCDEVDIDRCRLYGCGEVGVSAESGKGIRVTDTEIYGCSWGGAGVYDCFDVLFSGCSVYENGNDVYPAGNLANVSLSTYVSFMNCRFADNCVYSAVTVQYSSDVFFGGCEFSGNALSEGFLWAEESDVAFEGCAFPDTPLSGTEPVFNGAGEPVSYKELASSVLDPDVIRPDFGDGEFEGDYSYEIMPAPEGRYFEVSTADEFIASLGSRRVIAVKGSFVLSDSSYYGWAEGENWHWEPVFDGYTLVIDGVEDLAVTGDGAAVIMTEPRYADVLSFLNCDAIELEDVVAGHTEGEPGSCSGDVVRLSGCRDVELERCSLYGCGVTGVSAMYSSDIDLEDCEIYGCSSNGIFFTGVTRAEIENCRFHDNGAEAVFIDSESKKIELDGEKLLPGFYDF